MTESDQDFITKVSLSIYKKALDFKKALRKEIAKECREAIRKEITEVVRVVMDMASSGVDSGEYSSLYSQSTGLTNIMEIIRGD